MELCEFAFIKHHLEKGRYLKPLPMFLNSNYVIYSLLIVVAHPKPFCPLNTVQLKG